MIDPIGLAAGQFALGCAGRRWLAWWKRRCLAAAYRASAHETIELCVQEGYPAGSAEWNSVTDLLGSEERARQVAHWYTQGRVSSNELADMEKGDAAVGRFIQEFITRLNVRRTDLLPLDLANVVDILSARLASPSKYAPSSPPPQARGVTHWLGLPLSLDENFVGREAELDAISDDFESHRVLVVYGGAGTGKSRLAAEYARRAGTDGFWTSAGANFEQTLAALAPSLGVHVEERSDAETAAEVQRRLSELPAGTLWVVDNIKEIDLINELSTGANSIQLLVTTRDARRNLLPITIAFQHIDVLDLDSAIALLCSRRRPESTWDSQDPSLEEIAELVGRLPLALEMLAVRLGVPRQTPEDILDQLKTAATPIELEAFQQAVGATIPRIEGVYATIVGTLTDLPEELREQISPLGYVADAPILDPLLGALNGLGRGELDRLIEECSGRSIFSLVNEQVVVHALTIAAISATNEKGTAVTTLSRANERLFSMPESDPLTLRQEVAHYQSILDQSGKTVEPEAKGVLGYANNLAASYRSLGRNEAAVRLWEKVLTTRDRILGPEHPDTLGIRSNLAVGYRDLGRAEDSVKLDEETLGIREKVHGPEHPDTLASRNNLANSYQDLGRHEEAIRHLEEALSIMDRVHEPEHPDTLATRNNLAASYLVGGRIQDGVRLFGEILRIRERILGPEDPRTLDSRNNVANGYRILGRFGDALRVHEETHSIRERLLGPEHPDTLASRNNLAICHGDLGHHEEAARLYKETLGIKERVLGPEHPDTLASRNNLAAGYHHLGRYEEAVLLGRVTLMIYARVLGPEHPDTLQSRYNLALSYRALGRNSEADELESRHQ